jgi:hypothetical protein
LRHLSSVEVVCFDKKLRQRVCDLLSKNITCSIGDYCRDKFHVIVEAKLDHTDGLWKAIQIRYDKQHRGPNAIQTVQSSIRAEQHGITFGDFLYSIEQSYNCYSS